MRDALLSSCIMIIILAGYGIIIVGDKADGWGRCLGQMVGADGWGRDWERPISTKETPTLTVQFVAPRRQKKDRAQNRSGQDWVLAGRSNGSARTVPIRCSVPSKEGLSAKSGLARWDYSEG